MRTDYEPKHFSKKTYNEMIARLARSIFRRNEARRLRALLEPPLLLGKGDGGWEHLFLGPRAHGLY